MKEKDTYKEVRTIKHEGIVVRVHIPDLTEEERNRRMKDISQAASKLLLSQKTR